MTDILCLRLCPHVSVYKYSLPNIWRYKYLGAQCVKIQVLNTRHMKIQVFGAHHVKVQVLIAQLVKIQIFVAQWMKIRVFFRPINEDASLLRHAYEDTLSRPNTQHRKPKDFIFSNTAIKVSSHTSWMHVELSGGTPPPTLNLRTRWNLVHGLPRPI